MQRVERTARERPVFARLKDLTGGKSSVEAIVARLADELKQAGIKGKVQFTLVGGDKPQICGVTVNKTGAVTHKSAIARPDLEVITDAETWMRVMRGDLAPIDALAQRRLRIRGDARFGVVAIGRLAGTKGRIDICTTEEARHG